jgi:ribose transport system ATP-binding protein
LPSATTRILSTVPDEVAERTEAKVAGAPCTGDRNLVIDAQGLAKRYGNIHALRGVDFQLREGEIMGLVGENGAGKSTLVNILAGLVRPNAGRILIGGRHVEITGPTVSEQCGIAVVHQELSLVGNLSVAENVLLGKSDLPAIRRPRRQRELARPYLTRVGLDGLDPGTPADELAVAEKQLVEIARVLARDARIVILDEPTAALSASDIERVERMIETLAGEGHSIIMVTHHLDEIFRVANRVTVMRDGQAMAPADIERVSIDTVVERMLGRPLENMYPERRRPGQRATSTSEIAIALDHAIAPGLAAPVTMEVRRGEIVGLAGQLGSGASSVLRAMAGVQQVTAGAILVGDQARRIASVGDGIDAGVAYCSADRKLDGLFGGRSVRENLTAPAIRSITPHGWRSRRRERGLARDLAERFSVPTNRLGARAETLSGGNQQKVALGKWIGIRPRVLLIDDPTRGVDVGARGEIYRHLRRLADDGMAIVVASSDLQEVLGLSDRTFSFYRGRVVREYGHPADSSAVMRDITAPRSGSVTGE